MPAPTYEELAAALSTAQQWATLAALTLIIVGFALWVMPIGQCSECIHCRRERAEKASWCAQHRRPHSECRDEHRD